MNVALFSKLKTLKKFKPYIDEFFYGYSYPLFLSLVAIISYFFTIPLFGFTIFAVLACASLYLYKDLTPFLPPVFLFLFNFRDMAMLSSAYFYVLCGFCGVAIIAHFFIFRVRIFLGKLFIPLCLMILSLFMGGVLSDFLDDYLGGLAVIFAVGPVVLFEYFLLSNYVEPPKNFDLKKYLCSLVVISAFTASVTMLLIVSYHGTFPYKGLRLIGWGTSNTVASLILVATPCCCYLMTKAKIFTPFLLLFIAFVFALLLSNSDGCLGIFGFFMPLLLVVTFLCVDKNRKRLFLTEFAIFCIILFTILIIITRNYDFSNLLNTSDSGRLKIYEEALKLFVRYPIFGVGQGYVNLNVFNPSLDVLRQYNFHSSILHVMATMGTVGLLSFVYYVVQRFRILAGKNRFNLFVVLSFFMFESYALIDVSEFCIFPLLCIVTIIISVTEKVNNTSTENSLLKNNFNKKFNAKYISNFI